MSRYYILDADRNPVGITNILLWGFFLEDRKKCTVGRDKIGRFWVSTVFLGLDHDFGMERIIREYGGGVPKGFYAPLVFETMAFFNEKETAELGGKAFKYSPEAGYCHRWRSWKEAEEGHAHAVKLYTRYERALAHREKVLHAMEKKL